MGLAGVLFYTMSSEAQEEVAVLPTPTPIPPTPSPTSTQTATPTETPLPTPTGTPVIPINGGEEGGTPSEGAGEAPTVEPDATRVLESTAEITDFTPVAPPTPIATTPPTEEMPGSGGVLPSEKGILIWAGLGLMVLLIIGVSNHFRNQST